MNSQRFRSQDYFGHSNNHEYASRRYQQYQNSSLSLCFDITRDLAAEAAKFAQPKVKEAKARMLEFKGPDCGAGGRMLELKGPECVSVGRRRRRHASRRRRGNRSRSNSTENSGTNDTTYKENTITTRDTYQGTSSWTITSWSSSDTMSQPLIGARKTRSRKPRRGRSPTRRNSLNAVKNRSNSLDSAKRSTRGVSSDCRIMKIQRNKNETSEVDEQVATAMPQQQQREQKQILLRGSFRQNSFGPEKEENRSEASRNKAVCISAKSQTLAPPSASPKSESSQDLPPARALALSAPLEDMATIEMAAQGLQEHPYGMLNYFAECATDQKRESPISRPFPLPPPPPPLPPQTQHHLPKSRANSGPYEHLTKSNGSGPLLLPPKLPSAIESAAVKNGGVDVIIIVGKGSGQQTFPHNSHVLRYISDYFSQVMKPQTLNLHYSWIIDLSHKNVGEWKAFFPFLEPPVKRTVSVDIHNLPVLLPWFHEFQLPLLLHQCDIMLSSLNFPDLEQNPQPEDLQDVLLLLYAALSCDLPQTQTRGIEVLDSYLRGAPHLFLPYGGNNSSVSSLQRLIILLQCFPHFCEQLWHPVIRPYFPPDLDDFCDVDSVKGRDWMLANPLFLFLLREGIAKATRLKRCAQAVRSKTKHQNVAGDDTGTRSPSIAPGDHRQTNDLHTGNKISSTLAGELFQELSDPCGQEGEGEGEAKAVVSGDEPSQPVFLEMSYFLGQQFWGGGWNLEPRASREKEKRRLEKHQWLEDIVQRLKQHAEEEEESIHQDPDQGQNLQQDTLERSHGEAFLEHRDASSRFPNQQPSLHSPRGVPVTTEVEPGSGSVGKQLQSCHAEPSQHHELPPHLCEMKESLSHHFTHSSRGSKVRPPSGNSGSDVATVTTTPASTSRVSEHMTDHLSNDSCKRTFRC